MIVSVCRSDGVSLDFLPSCIILLNLKAQYLVLKVTPLCLHIWFHVYLDVFVAVCMYNLTGYLIEK